MTDREPLSVWWNEVERPPIKARCKRCEGTWPHWKESEIGVVSPTGIEHRGDHGGDTACGIDATGDNWWWPL